MCDCVGVCVSDCVVHAGVQHSSLVSGGPTCASNLESVAYNVGKMSPAVSSIKLRLATVVDVALASELSRVARAEYCRSLLLTWRVAHDEDTVGDTVSRLKPEPAGGPPSPPVMFVPPPEPHDADEELSSPMLLFLSQLLTPAFKGKTY